MKKVLAILAVSIVLFSCSNKEASSPTEAANVFLDALKKGDEAAFKSMLSKNDLEIMTFGEKMAKEVGLGDATVAKFKDEFMLKAKKASFSFKNEKIEGDKATVDVEVKDDEGIHNQQFNLVKESGAWKLSLFGGKNNNFKVNQMQEVADSIKAALKGVNIDSAANSMKDLFKNVEKNKDKFKELEKMAEEFEKAQK